MVGLWLACPHGVWFQSPDPHPFPKIRLQAFNVLMVRRPPFGCRSAGPRNSVQWDELMRGTYITMMITLWWTNIAMENDHRNSGVSHQKMVIFHGKMLVHQRVCLPVVVCNCIYNMVTAFKYVEGGPDREAPGGSMKYQFVYLQVVSVCWNELDSVCLNGRAGQGKPSRR